MPEPTTVAFLGEPFSFHYLAAQEFFGSEIILIPQGSFDDIMKAVSMVEDTLGIIAVDNSLAGNITDKGKTNIQRIIENDLIITDEIYFHVNLHIAALQKKNMQEIEIVYSHPVAIKESSNFLKEYPHLKFEETNSTAGGIKKIADEKLTNAAAIGNRKAIEQYGLTILHENIDNHPDNFTRFFIITASKVNFQQTTIQNPKASCVLQAADLAHAEKIVSEHQATISKTVQFKKGTEEYYYLEIESERMQHIDDVKFILQRKSENTRILGIYEKKKIV